MATRLSWLDTVGAKPRSNSPASGCARPNGANHRNANKPARNVGAKLLPQPRRARAAAFDRFDPKGATFMFIRFFSELSSSEPSLDGLRAVHPFCVKLTQGLLDFNHLR